MKQTFQIATSSPIEFTRILIDMAREGWDMDGESVEHAPQLIGNMWTITLVKDASDETSSSEASIVSAETEEKPATTQRRNSRKQG
jgi:hypothetical protein